MSHRVNVDQGTPDYKMIAPSVVAGWRGEGGEGVGRKVGQIM